MSLFTFLLMWVGVGLMIDFVIVIAKIFRLWRRQIAQRKCLGHSWPYSQHLLMLKYVMARERTYYATYFLWLTLDKTCGILSVVLSVGTLGMSFAEDGGLSSQIVSLLATLFVVFTLYVVPAKRSCDYLSAWRSCNEFINDVIAENRKITEYPKVLAEIEDTMGSD